MTNCHNFEDELSSSCVESYYTWQCHLLRATVFPYLSIAYFFPEHGDSVIYSDHVGYEESW